MKNTVENHEFKRKSFPLTNILTIPICASALSCLLLFVATKIVASIIRSSLDISDLFSNLSSLLPNFLFDKISLGPLILFIILDLFFKKPNLWGEPLFRRVLHHCSGCDRVLQGRTPIVYPLQGGSGPDVVLKEEHIQRVNDMLQNNQTSEYFVEPTVSPNTRSKLASKLVGGQFSTRSTLYYTDFTPKGQALLDEIGLAIQPSLSQIIGLPCKNSTKLQLGSSNFRAVLLRYEGSQANFGYHYDTEPWNCFRCLFLIKGRGKISSFDHYTTGKQMKNIPLTKPGDGLVFQGTQSLHGTKESFDKTSMRYMLGFQYRIGEDLEKDRKTICNSMRGMSTTDIVATFFARFFPILFMKLIAEIGIKIFNPDIVISYFASVFYPAFSFLSKTADAMYGKLLLGKAVKAFFYYAPTCPFYVAVFPSLLFIFLFIMSAFIQTLPMKIARYLRGSKSIDASSIHKNTSTDTLTSDESEHSKIRNSWFQELNQSSTPLNYSSSPYMNQQYLSLLPTFQTHFIPRDFFSLLGPSVPILICSAGDVCVLFPFLVYLLITENWLPAYFVDPEFECKSLARFYVMKGLFE